MALELRPNCEFRDRDLPPDATAARICTFAELRSGGHSRLVRVRAAYRARRTVMGRAIGDDGDKGGLTRLRASLALVLMIAGSAPAGATPAAVPPPAFLLNAVHSEKTLWLLYTGGDLRRLPDKAAAPETDPAAPRRPFGICRLGSHVVAVAEDASALVFYRHDGARWTTIGRAPREAGEQVLGLACQGPLPVLVTRSRLILPDAAPVKVLGDLPKGIRYSLFVQGDGVLVGSNMGEWGGGLARIDLATGRVDKIEGADAPIHDFAAAPGKPGCVVVAVGLVHMFASGKLSEVCGLSARRLFVAPFAQDGMKPRPAVGDHDPFPSVAFFGLAKDGPALIAVAIDGIRRIDAKGVGAARPLPHFTDRGDVRVAEASPRVMLVLTGINATASLGGAMPIAVVR